jgi:hypothetical protein
MYKIIGADQKEYGPVTGDQLRHWIAEGRVNTRTQVRAEGASEWQPLSAFPEFAEFFGAGAAAAASGPAPFAAAGSGRDAALQSVKAPAIALLITAVLNSILALWKLVELTLLHSNPEFLSGMPQFDNPEMQKMLHLLSGPVGVASAAFGLAMSVLVLIGALRMHALRSYSLALVASILAMVPCVTPCCVIGLPFGIWALVVLNKPEVRSQFS